MVQMRNVHQSPKPMWVSKLTLRIISIVLALILIGVSASLGTTWEHSPAAIVFFLPTACTSLIWNIAEGICLVVRGGHRGIHPGACVGVDLILWLGFSSCSIMFTLFGYGYLMYRYEAHFGYDNADKYYALNRVAISFGFIEVLPHFALFVIACVETGKRSHPAPIIVYQPPPGMMVPHGYPQQPMAYPPAPYNQHHQSSAYPNAYYPAPHGNQPNSMYAQGMPNVQNRDLSKAESEANPVSVSATAPSDRGQSERWT
ncbi:hypothetical protein LIA77_05118 [Sarocladium implicatum]|nr:hypothetical protein LIA77_05118 [Sarocladium implicatum]